MNNTKKVLVACEMSGIVRDAFIAEGCDAISCDIKDTISPGPHYKGDMFDGTLDLTSYDLIIAHPPCTAICSAGNWKYKGTKERTEGALFFLDIWKIPVKRMAIENPKGIMNTVMPCKRRLPMPQWVQPYWFGHTYQKKTGLWKRNLPDLVPTQMVEPIEGSRINNISGRGEELRELRSLTPLGFAQAMAKQWTPIL